MLNALAYLGYGFSEADVAGGGGAPSFLFTRAAFPFLGGRNERMRENFLEAADIRFGVAVPEPGDNGWRGVFELLECGLPVLLRVDMRYLPYLYGGKIGPAYMSFGWHVICLCGVDFDSGEACVTDTDRGGPCMVALRDLDKARGSSTKVYPPRREYAWIEPRPTLWSFDADRLARAALASILGNYDSPPSWALNGGSAKDSRAPLVGLSGLADFPAVLGSIHTIVNPYALGAAYSYMAASIERNGTGGAAFRRLFRAFLAARAADCANPELRAACAALVAPTEAAMAAWSSLAARLDDAAVALGGAKGAGKAAAVAEAEAATAGAARELYAAESALRNAIADVIGRDAGNGGT